MWEWSARIRVKPADVGSSFTVMIFLGEVPADPNEWITSPSYVGSHSAFTDNRAKKDTTTEGFVLLQEAIAERSGVEGFEPHVVTPYLREHLDWRISSAGGKEIPEKDVPSLEVTVVAVPLSFPPGAIFPVEGKPVYHDDITCGRPGGAHPNH